MKKNKTIKDIYEEYNNDSNIYNIEWEMFKQICYTFFKLVSKKIMYGEIFLLPSNMGRIYMRKFKSKKKAIDYHLTKKYYGEHNKNVKDKKDKKYIYHKNNHTFGLSARWFWNKEGYNFKNKSFYKFKPVRNNSRTSSKLMKTKNIIDKYENR